MDTNHPDEFIPVCGHDNCVAFAAAASRVAALSVITDLALSKGDDKLAFQSGRAYHREMAELERMP